MGDSYDFSRVQSAVQLKVALDDVNTRLYGQSREKEAAAIFANENAMAAQTLERSRIQEVIFNEHKLKDIKVGDLLELRDSQGDKKFALVKEVDRQTHASKLVSLHPTQAASLQQQFPDLHQVVVSDSDYNQTSPSGFGLLQFTPLAELFTALKEYILAVFEIIVGKQLSKDELESKALALTIGVVSTVLIAGSLFAVWFTQ